MTFHGEPRASHEVMHHVHESPPVMLVPLIVLAAGALFAGVIFHGYFIGEDYARVLEGGAVHAAGQPHPRGDPPRAALGEAGAVRRDAARLPASPDYFYIRSPRDAAAARRAARGLYQFLLNKWYFDELYDFLFVRPAKLARPLPVEEGRRLAHRRLRAGRRLGARARRHQPRGPAADRLPLPLRLRDADRRRRAGHLDDVRGRSL